MKPIEKEDLKPMKMIKTTKDKIMVKIDNALNKAYKKK